ncbi:MAG: hypothetical protein HY288_02850 [Planctomycetia bacterium]|nr:hypothetical protein [Planctomycetia bacterium]
MPSVSAATSRRWTWTVLVYAGAGWMTIWLAQVVSAHDSPEHVIEHLTARMARQGRTAELLYRRACEYRALGKLSAAELDLAAALQLKVDYQTARLELSRVQLAEGKTAAALSTIDRAIDGTAATDRAPLWIVRSDIYLALKKTGDALADCQAACAQRPLEVDWQLKRSGLQARLGRHDTRAAELKIAFEQTESGVLKIEWIEAMIDAGQMSAALEEIETELADCRFKSSWLLRRARARQGLGQSAAATDDLRAAIEELNRRIDPARPDGSLLGDRGLAYALWGDWKSTAENLTQARAAGADAWMLQRLETLLATRGGK